MPSKFVAFRLNKETMELLRSFKERNKCESWNETFVKLLKLEQQKIVTHSYIIQDLKPCQYRLLGCAKLRKEINLDQCLKCNMS